MESTGGDVEMNINIASTGVQIDLDLVSVDFAGGIEVWLQKYANRYNLPWLLAHADDGVIWGEVRDGALYRSNGLFEPHLRLDTLQMARLFGFGGELFLWKNDNSWSSRMVTDGEGNSKEYYDETHLLWGKDVEKRENGFIHLRHGEEGLHHAPPVGDGDVEPPLVLIVRNYIGYDDDGQAYVQFSRLVSIGPFVKKEVI